jgi:hypothetical protein
MGESLDQLSVSIPAKITEKLFYIDEMISHFPSVLLCCERKLSYGRDPRHANLSLYQKGAYYSGVKVLYSLHPNIKIIL